MSKLSVATLNVAVFLKAIAYTRKIGLFIFPATHYRLVLCFLWTLDHVEKLLHVLSNWMCVKEMSSKPLYQSLPLPINLIRSV